MKKLWFLALALVFVMMGTACSTSTSSTVSDDGNSSDESLTDTRTIDGYEVYQHENFDLYYPEDWSMEEDAYGTVVSVLSPLEDEADMFSENCNVVIDDMAADYSLDEYLAASLDTLKAYITGYDPIEEGTIEMDGEEGYYISYNGSQGDYTLSWVQYLVKPADNFYIVTCTSSADTYANYVDTFDSIASNFVGR